MNNNIGIVIQARLGSRRYPDKVTQFFRGKRIIEHIVDNLKSTGLPIHLAIPTGTHNDELEHFAKTQDLSYMRGPEDNVLMRIYGTAKAFKINTIVRICADSPLIDPHDVMECLEKFQCEGGKRMIWGMSCWVFSQQMLGEVIACSTHDEDKEHCGFHYMSRTIDYPDDLTRLDHGE